MEDICVAHYIFQFNKPCYYNNMHITTKQIHSGNKTSPYKPILWG